MLRKKPPNIMSGTRIGPMRANAALTDGTAHETNEPKATEQLATSIIDRAHMKNLPASASSPTIQYTIVTNRNGPIMNLGV